MTTASSRHGYLLRKSRDVLAALLLSALSLLAQSCSTDDPRDLCCECQAIIDFKYIMDDSDMLTYYINDMYHYLFGSDGSFITSYSCSSHVTYLKLSLPAGGYTLVSVGNPSERILLHGHPEEGLKAFMLTVQGATQPSSGSQCGEIYVGYNRFAISERKRHYFTTYMSNVHCRLDVKVVWDRKIPAQGAYDFHLEGLCGNYHLDHDLKTDCMGYDMPLRGGVRHDYTATATLLNQELYMSFVTLRYSDDDIPSISLTRQSATHDAPPESVIPPLDLSRAFREWGWSPDRNPRQNYRIRITIKNNDSFYVEPWIEGNVLDWVDGGTFS